MPDMTWLKAARQRLLSLLPWDADTLTHRRQVAGGKADGSKVLPTCCLLTALQFHHPFWLFYLQLMQAFLLSMLTAALLLGLWVAQHYLQGALPGQAERLQRVGAMLKEGATDPQQMIHRRLLWMLQ